MLGSKGRGRVVPRSLNGRLISGWREVVRQIRRGWGSRQGEMVRHLKGGGMGRRSELVRRLHRRLMNRPGKWVRETISNEPRGVLHAINPVSWDGSARQQLLTASYAGIHRLEFMNGKWAARASSESCLPGMLG